MGSLPINGIVHHVSTKGSSAMPSCVSPTVFRERPNIRSPVESPPLLKKPLRFSDTGRLVSKTLDSTLSCFLGPRTSGRGDSRKENRSILKTDSPRRTGNKGRLDRKVNFQQKVLVFHFDRNEGCHLSSENMKLNSEPEVKKSLLVQFSQPQTCHSNSSTPIALSGVSNSPLGCIPSTSSALPTSSTMHHQTVTMGRNQTVDGNAPRQSSLESQVSRRRQLPLPKALEERSLQAKDIDFHYVVDNNHNSILCFSLPLGPGISAGDVIVKANKTGNRVRVIGNESRPALSQRCRDINERFGLPVRVDSYRICARIDSTGVLFVEAPILPGELKHGAHIARKST